jgi:hypothetical protein
MSVQTILVLLIEDLDSPRENRISLQSPRVLEKTKILPDSDYKVGTWRCGHLPASGLYRPWARLSVHAWPTVRLSGRQAICKG